MSRSTFAAIAFCACAVSFLATYTPGHAQQRRQQQPAPARQQPAAAQQLDAVEVAQSGNTKPDIPDSPQPARPTGDHAAKDKPPMPITPALSEQPEQGTETGFVFALDAHNSKKPRQTFEEIMAADVEAKPGVMELQRKLLESRYNLDPKLDPEAKMSRGKPLAVGPTANLKNGLTWEDLGKMSAAEIKEADAFPYPSLPHPKHSTGGHNGEVVSINNFHRLFKNILTPVQLDGMRMLVTPLPQEEFNATDDRKHKDPSLGVACLDCHINGHTTAQFHLSPDFRPQERRMRLDTTSLRGMFNQQIHGSKRSLRSVEDFTEFEQRTAYFNGDPIRAMKKGIVILDRVRVSHMAQAQNMFDFPPAPKLDVFGRLDPMKATESELRGQEIFHGKARCAECHAGPFFIDHLMHDLHLERFLNEPGDGPIKTFTLRGIKDSPPYMHDGRCLTLEDTVEFFNLVLTLQLTPEEKQDLVHFMRAL
jgi:cytochrome c peroxidase